MQKIASIISFFKQIFVGQYEYWSLRTLKGMLFIRDHTEQNHILKGCTKHGVWGLRIQLATGNQQNVLFSDIINDSIKLQVWTEGAHHTNYDQIRSKLCCLLTNNINLLSATTTHLLEELYAGVSVLCQDICHRYTTLIGDQLNNIKATVINKATLSSKKIKLHYSLPSFHPPIIHFWDNMNRTWEMAFCSTYYGNFNTITTDPILTYTKVCISSICISITWLLFITDTRIFEVRRIRKGFETGSATPLWCHCRDVIAELLAESGKLDDEGLLLEPKTDRQIFYVFWALMRIWNSHYFSSWTVINTAAYHGKSNSNITSFLGLLLYPLSVCRRN